VSNGNSDSAIPRRIEQALSGIYVEADNLADTLDQVWVQPRGSSESLEAVALHHTVQLEGLLEQSSSVDGNLLLFPLDPGHARPDTRYDIEAAALMIPRILPFSEVFGLPRLKAISVEGVGEWAAAVADREPRLVKVWHRWLWTPERAPLDPARDHGASSVLAVAVRTLRDGLAVVLSADSQG
jgi:hypothetical protein